MIAEITGSTGLLEGIGAKGYGENQVMNLLADMSEVKADTGFSCQVDFETGIGRTIAYMRGMGQQY